MWAEDIRNKADVIAMEPDMVKTTNQLRNVMLTWMSGMAGYLGYFFKHTDFKYIMLATVAVGSENLQSYMSKGSRTL